MRHIKPFVGYHHFTPTLIEDELLLMIDDGKCVATGGDHYKTFYFNDRSDFDKYDIKFKQMRLDNFFSRNGAIIVYSEELKKFLTSKLDIAEKLAYPSMTRYMWVVGEGKRKKVLMEEFLNMGNIKEIRMSHDFYSDVKNKYGIQHNAHITLFVEDVLKKYNCYFEDVNVTAYSYAVTRIPKNVCPQDKF